MTIDVLSQQPMPSHPHRRDGKAPLPSPEERARLRRAWRLTEEHVAVAFGVTEATVRSWEAGRTAPTGLRRAAYAAFLGGLAQGLVPAPATPDAARCAGRPSRRSARRRVVRAVEEHPPVVAAPPGRTAPGGVEVMPGRAPATLGVPVGAGPDPVSAGRRRRFRFVTVAAGAWTVVLHLMMTTPPPHP
ncbi:helix-turn-helix domain-containing protein [Streptomyces geranii]|uniref:hypothetical protein n=1 Tax=Streptomyces geranii TaxID=2058923 RepID=UPI000D026883|nr:hypothetical protein [Streptomyces geranii]